MVSHEPIETGAPKKNVPRPARFFDDVSRDGPPLRFVRVEQPIRRPALDNAGQFPAEVKGVSDPRIHSLSAQRAVNVRGIAGQNILPIR